MIAYGLSYSRIAFSFAVVITVGIAYERFSGGWQDEGIDDQYDGRFYYKYYFRSRPDLRTGTVSEMGMEGAAVATGIGQVITLLVYLAFYYASPIPVKVQLKSWRPDRETANGCTVSEFPQR